MKPVSVKGKSEQATAGTADFHGCDGLSQILRARLCPIWHCARNPPNGSWGMDKVQPTPQTQLSRIPPTAFGGWLSSNLQGFGNCPSGVRGLTVHNDCSMRDQT